MKFTFTTAIFYLLLKLTLLFVNRSNVNIDNSTVLPFVDINNTDFKFSLAFSHVKSWHSISFNESAVSMILAKQTTLRAAHTVRSFSIIKHSPQYINTSSSNKMVASYLFVLLMVNACDVEVNPGPYKPKFPCHVCSLAVKWGQKGVMCDCCSSWYHTDCMGMSTQTYENLDGSRVIWICDACGEPNYSAGHLFSTSSFETSNSFSSLGSLNDDGALKLGSPKATSSPVAKPSKSNPKHKQKKHESLRILVVNCQSVSAKREALHACIENNKPHVIIASESWLNESIHL